jgi:hypothetical protein
MQTGIAPFFNPPRCRLPWPLPTYFLFLAQLFTNVARFLTAAGIFPYCQHCRTHTDFCSVGTGLKWPKHGADHSLFWCPDKGFVEFAFIPPHISMASCAETRSAACTCAAGANFSSRSDRWGQASLILETQSHVWHNKNLLPYHS